MKADLVSKADLLPKADFVSDVVSQLVELAISMAEAHLEGRDLENTLEDIAYKGEQAYEDHTGEPLDPFLIRAEEEL